MPLFAWVAIDMLLWGFLTKYLNTVAPPGFNFVPALLGAVLFWDFFIRIMQGVTMAFFEHGWSRHFMSMFASRLRVSEYVVGLIVASILTSMIGLLVMFVIAAVVFNLSFLIYGLMALPFLLILFLFGIAIGILGCALVMRFGPSAEWFIWPIPALISPFVGVLYPISTLPQWMRVISRCLPPSYVFESLRAFVAGSAVSPAALLVSGCLAGGYICLAYWVFSRVHQHALRNGLIARYSAESVS